MNEPEPVPTIADKKSIHSGGWWLVGIGLPFFLAFTVMFVVGLHKIHTYQFAEAHATKWTPYLADNDGFMEPVNEGLTTDDRERDNLFYVPDLEFKLPNGETFSYLGGGYDEGQKRNFTHQTIVFKMGPQFEHLEYSVITAYFAPLGCMLITGAVAFLGFKFILAERRKKHPQKQPRKLYEPYHPSG